MDLCLSVDSCSSFSPPLCVSHYRSWMHSGFPLIALKCSLRAAVLRSSQSQPRWRVPCHIPCCTCPCPAIPPYSGENKPSCLSPQHTWVTQAQGSLLCLVPLVPGCHECCSHDSCKGRQVPREDLAGSCKTCLFFLHPMRLPGPGQVLALVPCHLPPAGSMPGKAAALSLLSPPAEANFLPQRREHPPAPWPSVAH